MYQEKIANCFNKFFVYIFVPKQASIIRELQAKFDLYLNPYQTFMGEVNLIVDDLKKVLKSLKPNQSPGRDSISSNE